MTGKSIIPHGLLPSGPMFDVSFCSEIAENTLA